MPAPVSWKQRLPRPVLRGLVRVKWSLRPLLRPRAFQAYCVGTPKSGTHSIAGLFEDRYRTLHEPEAGSVVPAIRRIVDGCWDPARVVRFVRERDQRLWVEMESSTYLLHFLPALVRSFPKARFILTLRDPVSWLDSWFNHARTHDPGPAWMELRKIRFATPGRPHPPEERVLEDLGLPTLEGCLGYWSRHNRTVLETVPQARLLVVRTSQIGASLERIAAFVGVPASTLSPAKSHQYKARARLGLLGQLPERHLAGALRTHAGPLVERFFPELRTW